MIELQILNGRMAGSSWAARHFPVRIGRSADCDLRLEETGVWDRHLTIGLDPAAGISLRAEAEALVTVNQQPVQDHLLRPGDSLEIGSVRMRFWIAEPARRGLRVNDLALWTLCGVVLGVEVWLLLQLVR